MPHFERQRIYNRLEIHTKYGGNHQTGISLSTNNPIIFLFTNENGRRFGYEDAWDEANQIYTYTGQGRIGDMDITCGNNLAIRNHVQDGKTIYLFKKASQSEINHELPEHQGYGYYRYIDELQCVGFIETEGPDQEGTIRRIYKFELVRISSLYEDEGIENLRERAYEAINVDVLSPQERNVKQRIYRRSHAVKRYVLKRANGLCESCNAKAPFRTVNGSLYLEAHHINRVSDGGIDAPNYVAAICPTCHRRIHCGHDGSDINKDLSQKIQNIENKMK